LKTTRWILSSIAMLLVLVACNGSGSQPQPEPFRMDLSEYAFNPSTIEVRDGQQVSLELVNIGAVDHEIMFGRDVMLTDDRPSGYMNDLFASSGIDPKVNGGEMEEHMGHEGFTVVVKPGESATLTFTLTEGAVGDWEFGCFEQEGVHYDAGMKGSFTVKP